MLPKLEELFETQVLTPEFLYIWGEILKNACGFIHAYYFALDDLYIRRGAQIGSNITDLLWVAVFHSVLSVPITVEIWPPKILDG